ncbi:MAG: SAM-dependent methyltransferase [Nitrospirae bacterium]|nr:SAM-dependent methyltransferase [Nitrospirota bacterium]
MSNSHNLGIISTMNPLEEIIIDKIKKEGPVTFETFMDMALYYPELGYYSSGKTAIGRAGDFYTSPHLHPVFGAMLARQLMEMWMVMGKPSVFHAVEIGAGAGYLCKDILDYLHKTSKNPSLSKVESDFLKSLKYVIVEPFSHFEEKQREMIGEYLKDFSTHCSGGFETRHYENKDEIVEATPCGCHELITWVKSLKELNDGNPSVSPLTKGGIKRGLQITGCIFFNELLDAFPVHLVEMEDDLKEIYVDFNGKEFVEVKKEVSSPELINYLKEFSVHLQEGCKTEINLRIKRWLEEAGAALSKGFLLTIDYGYSEREYYSEERTKGTLLCYHKHQCNENPYRDIGEQDITAHVNFSSLKKWGEELGLKTIGYCRQGIFLTASGIDEIITELYSDAADYSFELAKIKGLIFPQGMGESHNVIVQYKGEGSPELRGFSIRNQKGNL